MRAVRLAGALIAGALVVARGASAQAPDSTRVVANSAPDSARALPRPSVALPDAEPGRDATPVAAATSALSAEALVALAPAALVAVFDYRLGAPGRSGGLSVDGLDPARVALLLDGRPFDDLVTGAPRPDLLPLAALGPLRISDGRLGSPVSLDAQTRLFRLGRPVTELRYLTGQSGVQAVSATHAQTRLPPGFLRGGSRDARITVVGHVMSRNGRGTLTGAQLRHTDVFGRTLLTRPGVAVDAGVLYTDRTDGARRGVVPGSAESIFSLASMVVEPTATRRTLRAEAYATARLALIGSQPTVVTAALVRQRLVYRSSTSGATTADTLRVHAERAFVRVAQPLGGTRLLRLDATADAAPSVGRDRLGGSGARLRLHAALRDSVSIGTASATVEGGVHLDGTRVFPSASLRAERGAAFAALRVGGAHGGRLDGGLGGYVGAADGGGAERVALAEAGTQIARGDLRVGVRAFGTARQNARLLVARADSFAFETAPSLLAAAGLAVTAGVREATARGLYGRLSATAHAPLRAGASDLARRDADALPRLRADVRVGSRARGIGGVLDLDLAVVGRAWTGFRGRTVEPRTGLLALPDPVGDFGRTLPARGTLGAEAAATFSGRATVFLQLDHALGQLVGAAVVQGEPLPVRVLRFGVFWALLD